MRFLSTDVLAPTLIALIGCVFLSDWLTIGRSVDRQLREPGQDHVQTGQRASTATVLQAQTPTVGRGKPAAVSGSWSGFRGDHRDAISTDSTSLASVWAADGPPVLWSVPLGEGYAGPAISNGRVFVLDYDQQQQCDTLRSLSLDDGAEIWHNSYPVQLTRNHGMSRTVPVLHKGHVLTLGPRCQLACWDQATGTCQWIMDLVQQFGTTVPRWYTGQCPLVANDNVIVAPCGPQALLAAVDVATGKTVWQTANPRNWKMTHSSIVTMRLGDRETFVYCADQGIVGVDAEDGQLVWESTEWTEKFATSPSPVVLPGNRIFVSSGYDGAVGAKILRIEQRDSQYIVTVESTLAPAQFNAEQQTPILRDGHLFGVRKRGGGQLVCMNLDGEPLWDSGNDRFGHGPFLFADGRLLLLDNNGTLTMATASAEGYERLAQAVVLEDAHDAWGPMAVVAG
ncbi:MAG: PQQ-binding-like beta-propeller repeat protein, partial [Planctomycetales bacterium]|nr:PQQ-binding-like beta-propeller repeat protein [Planctomycetales bacterium]